MRGKITKKSQAKIDHERIIGMSKVMKEITPKALFNKIGELTVELTELRASLAKMTERHGKLREALKYINNRNYTGASFVASEALNHDLKYQAEEKCERCLDSHLRYLCGKCTDGISGILASDKTSANESGEG